MQWHKVEICGSDAGELRTKAVALKERFGRRYFEAKFPEGAHVYVHDSNKLQHVYYLSPVASEWLMTEPPWSGAMPCEEPSDLATLKKVEF